MALQTIDIQPAQSGLTITTRKPSASIYAVKSARHTTGIRRGTGARRGAGIAAQKAKAGYRPDLRKVRYDLPVFVFRRIPSVFPTFRPILEV